MAKDREINDLKLKIKKLKGKDTTDVSSYSTCVFSAVFSVVLYGISTSDYNVTYYLWH